jgi:hypothetical protein
LNQCPNENEGLEKLLVSLIKMVGKTNEKVDSLSRRIHQLEMAAIEQQEQLSLPFLAVQAQQAELESM